MLGAGLDERLVRRLVYGTLRHLRRVDRLLQEASSRPLGAIEPGLLDILRVATWELRFGEGAPHAAVNEAVKIATGAHGKRAGGFANAVLRAVQRADEELPPGAEGRALELGTAPWVLERLAIAWGEHEAADFLRASLEPAARTARRRPGTDAGGEPINGIPDAVEAGGEATGLIPMDPSSVAVGWAVAPQRGMTVLDMAAAPGGKTMHLFDQMGGGGLLVAADRHRRRVESARRRLHRLGVKLPWVVADGVRAPFESGTFDRVLLDAPCTGLGTLRRRPEIRHRLTESSPAEAAALQQRLLDSALALVKPAGCVVYSVCTVFPEETTEVVAGRRAEPPDGLPGRPAGNGWLLGPHLTGSDGMFISLVRP
jgi:16S rRNA (cytosine967-C5)-methyltransferase